MKYKHILFVVLLQFRILSLATCFAEEEVLTRAFTIKFRKVEDAVTTVNRLLSEKGAITIQPHIKTLIVQDYESNLKKIEEVLTSFDSPPASVNISVKLVLAEKKYRGFAQNEKIGDLERLGEVLRFNHYSLLDDGSITSEQGRGATLNLGGQYQVTFVPDVLQEQNGRIRLKNFELKKIRKGKGGKEAESPLLSMTLNLRNSETLVLGASRFENSDQALLLILVGKVNK